MCFCSTDLAKENRFPAVTCVNSPKGTQIMTIMIFKWSELKKDTADRQANLSKVILRIYKDAATTKEKCSKVTLYAKVFYQYSSGGEIEITGTKIDIELSNGRKWEDLDLTPPGSLKKP